MTTTFDPSIESEVRNHCWNYFALHAQQRMSAFQFFITLETALIGAGLLVLQSDFSSDSHFKIVIGPMIILLSFVFWKIDQRTKDLIKGAEVGLKEIENFFLANTKVAVHLPFLSDAQTNNTLVSFPLLPGRLTYSKSFGAVFIGSAFFGALLTFALANN